MTDEYPLPVEESPSEVLAEAVEIPKVEHCTDSGNAIRVAREFGTIFRYVADRGYFIVWNGKYWEADSAGTKMMQLAKRTAERMYHEGCRKGGDAGDKLKKFSLESESLKRLRAMIELVKSESEIIVSSKDLDKNLFLLNVQNGTIDLKTAALQQHNRNDLLTKIAPINMPATSQGDCPVFKRFLGEIFRNDGDLIDFIQRSMGYYLTGSTSEQKFFYFYGTGANGKSTLLNVLSWILGPYAKTVPSEIFMARDNKGGPTPELAQLPGVRLVVSSENEEGQRMAETLVKSLTGGDVVSARQLHKPPFEFTPAFKPVMAGNHKPDIRGTDTGIWRRIVLVPFTVSIPPEKQDRNLPEKLKAELPEILKWAVQGCAQWQREGLAVPKAVESATNDYRSDMDIIGNWLSESCAQGSEYETQAAKIYESYREWATANGYRCVSQKKLSGALKDRGFQSVKKSTVSWMGLGLIDDYSVSSRGVL